VKLVAAIGAADSVAPGRPVNSAARSQRRRRGHPWQAQLSHYCGDVAPSNCLSAAGSSRQELTPSFGFGHLRESGSAPEPAGEYRRAEGLEVRGQPRDWTRDPPAAGPAAGSAGGRAQIVRFGRLWSEAAHSSAPPCRRVSATW